MDVKDVKYTASAQLVAQTGSTSDLSDSNKYPVQQQMSGDESQGVRVDVEQRRRSSSDLVATLNTAIGVANVAANAVDEIDRYVRGIIGIVEQVDDGNVPGNRIGILENEANQLVEAVKETIKVQTPNGIHPLEGEAYTAAVEESLGKTLEVILPDLSRDALGLGEVKLTTRDFILNTRAAVLRSQEQIQSLREALNETTKKLTQIAAEVDIAAQNIESSNATIREVESALSMAGKTGTNINENPNEALGSVGKLDFYSIGLLRQDS